MASAIYLLSALVTGLCAFQLLVAYRRARRPLLLWSGLCFAALTLSHTLVFIDLVLIPDVDLYLLRLVATAVALGLESFLLGVVATASAVVALFFLRFWRSTRDGLFLTFAAAFGIETVLRIARLGYVHTGQAGEGAPVMYAIRLLASLLILAAILRKNTGKAR